MRDDVDDFHDAVDVSIVRVDQGSNSALRFPGRPTEVATIDEIEQVASLLGGKHHAGGLEKFQAGVFRRIVRRGDLHRPALLLAPRKPSVGVAIAPQSETSQPVAAIAAATARSNVAAEARPS